jgi:hypothetical protein
MLIINGVPQLDAATLENASDLSELSAHFADGADSDTLTRSSDIFSFYASAYGSSTGFVASEQYDSYFFAAEHDGDFYMSSIGSGSYMQLCVYPTGEFNDPDYVRYRNADNNLPLAASPLHITVGTMLIISTNKTNLTWSYHYAYDSLALAPSVKLAPQQIAQVFAETWYQVSYIGGVLTVSGNGIDCAFSNLQFDSQPGLFELQNLTYNNAVIFGTDNDYIGPVRIHGESIKGAKHGGETTDTVRIIADGVELIDGESVTCRSFTVYVLSHIIDEFNRISSYSFNRDGFFASSTLPTLKELHIDYIFGCGIISCQDATNIAWLNKYPLTAEVLTGLNTDTLIVTTGGTLMSRRISVSTGIGDQRVSFTPYTGRKKLYYYTCYGSDITVPSGTVFSSCAELRFL